jgi:hypothetical protein
LAGAQHQRKSGGAGGDGEPIGALHLSGGQNFHIKSPVKPPHPEAFALLSEAKPLMVA